MGLQHLPGGFLSLLRDCRLPLLVIFVIGHAGELEAGCLDAKVNLSQSPSARTLFLAADTCEQS